MGLTLVERELTPAMRRRGLAGGPGFFLVIPDSPFSLPVVGAFFDRLLLVMLDLSFLLFFRDYRNPRRAQLKERAQLKCDAEERKTETRKNENCISK